MGPLVDFWPFLLIGLFNGSVYALAAMGVVLTYRTSGTFNFAYGAMAMFCGFSFWQLRDGWHLTSWIALPLLLLVVAPLLGLAAERLFRSASSLAAEVQIVIALGALAFLQALVPLVFGGEVRGLAGILPDATFALGSRLYVSYTQVFTLLLAAGSAVGLSLVLRRTRFGAQASAVIDNPDLAELVGVNSVAMSRLAWVVSTIFAAIVGVLLSASQGLDVYTLVVVVIFAFAPAVFGRLVSLPLAFAGAMALGVLQSVLARWGSSGIVADLEAALPHLALFVLLIVSARRLREVRSSVVPTGRTRRATPWHLADLRVPAAAFALVVAILPWLLDPSDLRQVTAGVVYAMLGLTLVVLTGWAGQISLAQFSFAGIGAFSAAHFAGGDGSRFLLAMAAAALIAVPVGVLVGLPSLRVSGLYLALATMALALVFDTLVFSRRSISGGFTGVTVARPRIAGLSLASPTRFYFFCVVVLGLLMLAATMVRRGPIGRRLQLVGDAPVAASTSGINLSRTKLAVFVACGAVAALAGTLFGALRVAVAPSDFTFGASLQLLLLVVVGGRTLVGGALVAGAVHTLQLLPGAASVQPYVPLSIALVVLFVARYPEGPIPIVGGIFHRNVAVFRSRAAAPAGAARGPVAVVAGRGAHAG